MILSELLQLLGQLQSTMNKKSSIDIEKAIQRIGRSRVYRQLGYWGHVPVQSGEKWTAVRQMLEAIEQDEQLCQGKLAWTDAVVEILGKLKDALRPPSPSYLWEKSYVMVPVVEVNSLRSWIVYLRVQGFIGRAMDTWHIGRLTQADQGLRTGQGDCSHGHLAHWQAHPRGILACCELQLL